MTLYTGLPICDHSPERAHTNTHSTHSTQAHTWGALATVTVLTEGNCVCECVCAASVQSQPIMGLVVATVQCRPYCWSLKGIMALPNQISIRFPTQTHTCTHLKTKAAWLSTNPQISPDPPALLRSICQLLCSCQFFCSINSILLCNQSGIYTGNKNEKV